MTQTERKYVQIEKELLHVAIVCGCEKFDQYIYGHKVTVETDHKLLVSISQKPIHNALAAMSCHRFTGLRCSLLLTTRSRDLNIQQNEIFSNIVSLIQTIIWPKHLQRMMLHLQRYDLCITYKGGSEMYLADALSRAYPDQSVPQSSPQSEFCHTVEALDLTEHLPISAKRLKQIQEASNKDDTLQTLKQQIISGWPPQKSYTPPETRPYLKCQDKLSVQDDIVFKGSRIVLPTALRKDLLLKIHKGHLGVESCLR